MCLGPRVLCYIGYLSETHFELKSRENPFVHSIRFSCPIVLKFRTEHCSTTAVLCTRFQNDLITYELVMGKRDFTRFEFLTGNIAQHPRQELEVLSSIRWFHVCVSTQMAISGVWNETHHFQINFISWSAPPPPNLSSQPQTQHVLMLHRSISKIIVMFTPIHHKRHLFDRPMIYSWSSLAIKFTLYYIYRKPTYKTLTVKPLI